MHEALGDLERLHEACSTWELRDLSCEPTSCSDCRGAESGKRQVTVAVRNGKSIVAVWPGFKDTLFGIAFDVGSTTIAAHLCDLG